MTVHVGDVVEIVRASTAVYRLGSVVTESRPGLLREMEDAVDQGRPLPGGTVEIYAYPPVERARLDEEVIDMVFIAVGVSANTRERDLLSAALDDGVFPEYSTQMSDGPSYVHLGAELGDQEMALRLMALGQSLGMWKVMTPRELGFEDAESIRQYAGGGFIYAVGWKGAHAEAV